MITYLDCQECRWESSCPPWTREPASLCHRGCCCSCCTGATRSCPPCSRSLSLTQLLHHSFHIYTDKILLTSVTMGPHVWWHSSWQLNSIHIYLNILVLVNRALRLNCRYSLTIQQCSRHKKDCRFWPSTDPTVSHEPPPVRHFTPTLFSKRRAGTFIWKSGVLSVFF